MKTKTQIAIAVTLGVLFLAVPSATPKGKPASVTLGVVCNEPNPDNGSDSDSCTFTGMGMSSGTDGAPDLVEGW